MKNVISFLVVLLLVCSSCYEKPTLSLDINASVLIPLPKVVQPNATSFVFDKDTKIYSSTPAGVPTAAEFSKYLVTIGIPKITVLVVKDTNVTNAIHFIVDTTLRDSTTTEGYAISSNDQRVLVTSGTQEGLYRAMQTLRQLVPLEAVHSQEWEGDIWAIPGGEIIDEPTFAYRGAMLDVARHFFKVADVKRYIDVLSLYKINTLHLHLADDQGWRIEIKSWPKLTGIGGSTAVGGGKGGFYTQEDYKEIVDYALQKHITIIPEIDMPGHTNAALASYPELNCNNKSPKLYTGMRVGFSSLCVEKEITYQFVNDVVRELAAITPGDYIHLGGDESHATSKKDYITFLQQVFPIIRKYKKKVMGWEDIQSAGIDEQTIIQHWTNKGKATAGAKQGAQIVLSPAPFTYLDMKYNDSTTLGLTWAGTISIEKAYDWNPMEALDGNYAAQIIGIESPLWTETVTTIDELEYMAFPRIIGHAALGWNGKPRLDKQSYFDDLNLEYQRLDSLKVHYYKK